MCKRRAAPDGATTHCIRGKFTARTLPVPGSVRNEFHAPVCTGETFR
jgi:hypothetical protein